MNTCWQTIRCPRLIDKLADLARVVLTIALLSETASADVRLPAVINSHMVLQQNAPLPIWGWAAAGEQVTVTLGEFVAKTNAGDSGKWSVTLPAMKADGKKHSLQVVGTNTIELEDILIGQVWVGSGQSNMEWPLTSTNDAKEAIAAADHPNIRLFHLPRFARAKRQDDVVATWKVCTPANVPQFSAVLYYYGKKLHEELDVPIGLINSSWGGSAIEPWIIADGKSGAMCGMYNGMIAPLQPFAVKGAIWYQGEEDVIQKNGLKYFGRMKALIEGWRKSWSQDLPFYFVQIAPFISWRYEAGQLPALWESQAESLKIPHTGMVVITDIVNVRNLHPPNKLDVGNRLALWALAKSYDQELVYSGPLYKSMSIEGDKVRLSFAHAAGLKSRDGKPLTEFKIADTDGNLVDAVAEIDGETIVVSADGVKSPKHVRFGWHKLANPNLVNGAGLPASPFQTDKWRGGTGED